MGTNLESTISKELSKLNLSPDELKLILKQLRNKERPTRNKFVDNTKKKEVTYGIISDLHIGSKYFSDECFDYSAKVFNSSVDEILIPGDIIEGMSNRDGHIYELRSDGIGVSNQIKLAEEYLNQYKKPIKFICGNHDLFSVKKSNQGVEIGPELEKRVSNSKYLGDFSADIHLGKNAIVRLSHEGNTAYALSYSLQKIINSLSGGEKPNIILNGHLHKSIYMFYRNVHAFESGTSQKQTPFMREKGSPAHVGFWTLKLKYDANGFSELISSFHPFY